MVLREGINLNWDTLRTALSVPNRLGRGFQIQSISTFDAEITGLPFVQVGPVSKDEIRSLYAKGRIGDGFLFCTAAMAEPAPLVSLRELRWCVATGAGRKRLQWSESARQTRTVNDSQCQKRPLCQQRPWVATSQASSEQRIKAPR